VAIERRLFHHLLTLGGRKRRQLALRRIDQRAVHDGGLAFVIEKRYQRFADAELSDYGFDVEILILPKRRRGRLHRFLVARGERAQRMLHAIAQLAENGLRNVQRILRAKVNTDTL
jgi:hypothetical protein